MEKYLTSNCCKRKMKSNLLPIEIYFSVFSKLKNKYEKKTDGKKIFRCWSQIKIESYWYFLIGKIFIFYLVLWMVFLGEIERVDSNKKAVWMENFFRIWLTWESFWIFYIGIAESESNLSNILSYNDFVLVFYDFNKRFLWNSSTKIFRNFPCSLK